MVKKRYINTPIQFLINNATVTWVVKLDNLSVSSTKLNNCKSKSSPQVH